MLVKLLANLGLVRAVWLQDRWGKTYMSIAKRVPFDTAHCHVYPFTHVGDVTLYADGSTGGACYIERWATYEPIWRRWRHAQA